MEHEINLFGLHHLHEPHRGAAVAEKGKITTCQENEAFLAAKTSLLDR